MSNLSQVQAWVSQPRFEKLVLIAIVLNAITLGLETSDSLMARWSFWLYAIDKFFLFFFTAEILLKMYAWRLRFARDPWNLFDFVIVAIAWFPAAGSFSVLRSLRILRALRLISTIPQLKKVVTGLLSSLPGLGAVTSILLLIFYVGAVMATKLFGEAFPEWFGNIPASAYSLFQIMTLESWSMGIVRPVMQQFPYAWLFFVPFILVTTFTTLNLLIAVIVNAMQAETEAVAEIRAKEGHDERLKLLSEMREIKVQLQKLRSQIERSNP